MFIHTNISSLSWNSRLLEKIWSELDEKELKKLENETCRNIRKNTIRFKYEITFELFFNSQWDEIAFSLSSAGENEIRLQLESSYPHNCEQAKSVIGKIEESIRRIPDVSLRFLTGQYVLSVDYEAPISAISSRMTVIQKSSSVSTRNLMDSLSLMKCAEDSLSSIQDYLSSSSGQEKIIEMIEKSNFNGIFYLKKGINIQTEIFHINIPPFSPDLSQLNIEEISSRRADIGSWISRIEFTLDNLSGI